MNWITSIALYSLQVICVLSMIIYIGSFFFAPKVNAGLGELVWHSIILFWVCEACIELKKQPR